MGEELFGGAVFDQLAEVHEEDVIGEAFGLAEDVGDDEDGVVAAEFLEAALH